MQILLAESAALYDGFAGIQLDCRGTRAPVVPVYEVACIGGELTVGAAHPHAAINRSPERTVHQAHLAIYLRSDFQADRVGAAPSPHELAVRDQKSRGLRLLDNDGALAGVG